LPLARFFGVGGSACLAEGMELVLNSESLNVVGITDWMDRVGEVLGGYRAVVREIRRRRPDAAVLLDLPDFNLKLAAKLKAAEILVGYYISPQVWAWRKYRIRTIRRYVDTMLVVFPFEREFYRAHGVEVRFVGHPLVDSIEERRSYRSPDEIRSSPRVALLP